MWNEIWNFFKDNFGIIIVGIAVLIFVFQRYVYTKFKQRRFEKKVPIAEQVPIRDQPNYTPLFKEKIEDFTEE